MDLHPDFRDLLAEFVRAKVDFVIVGGYAVGHHAKPRATKDLDLLVSGRPDNLERVCQALRSFGAPPAIVEAAKALAPSDVLYFGAPPIRVDILRVVDGVDTEAAIERGVGLQLGDLDVKVLALDDLLANKRAAARPQDLADVALLERVRARGG